MPQQVSDEKECSIHEGEHADDFPCVVAIQLGCHRGHAGLNLLRREQNTFKIS
jgi:hypothetical protein